MAVDAASAEGSERREGGKRGRRPGRKATLDKSDMKAKLGTVIRKTIVTTSLTSTFARLRRMIFLSSKRL